MVLGEHVEGGKAMGVGGGGDHLPRPGDEGAAGSELVGAAQVAGKEGDGEFAGIVHHHYRRVCVLCLDQGSNHPHHDAGRHDEDEAFMIRPEPSYQLLQLTGERDGILPRLAAILLEDKEGGIAEAVPEPDAEPGAVPGYGDDGNLHTVFTTETHRA